MDIQKDTTVIIQQVYRGSEYAELLALTMSRHTMYCHAHGFEYQAFYSNIVNEWDKRFGGWAKLALIQSLLHAGYENIIWVDADAVIADLDADLREGCPKQGGIGMTINTQPCDHYNVGMLYVRNVPGVMEFIDYWISWFPGPVNGWHEQAVINLLAEVPAYQDMIHGIDYKYNSCVAGGTHVENAVVEAFHGGGNAKERLQSMKDFLNIKEVEHA